MVTVKDIKNLSAEQWTLEEMTDFAQAWMDEAEKQQRIAARLAKSNGELVAACEMAIKTYRLILGTSYPGHPDHEYLAGELSEIKAAVDNAGKIEAADDVLHS